MPKRFVLFLICLLVAVSLVRLDAQSATLGRSPEGPGQARIDGTVVNGVTRKPLQAARVELRRYPDDGMPLHSTMTDNSGKYSIANIPAGRYSLAASHELFVSGQYGAGEAGRPGVELLVSAGQALQNVTISLTPHSVIAGRVLDASGKAVPRAIVICERITFQHGKTEFRMVARASSNDLGKYRFFGLSSGRYVIAALPPEQPGGMIPLARAGHIRTFYKSASDATGALPITLAAAHELHDVDIQLVVGQVFSVEGRIAGVGSASARRALLLLTRAQNGIIETAVPVPLSAAGTFEVQNLPAGRYVLTGYLIEDGRQYAGKRDFVIEKESIHGLEFSLGKPIELLGRVFSDDKSVLSAPGLRISLAPEARLPIGIAPAAVQADGTFSFPAVAPERYFVEVLGLPKNMYVKSVAVGNQDCTDHALDVSAESGAISIVIGRNGGEVQGSVQIDRGLPLAATLVMIPYPDGKARWRLYRKAVTDQYGRFSIHGIEPGTYSIYACRNLEEKAQESAAFVTNNKALGTILHVEGGGVQRLSLIAINVDGQTNNVWRVRSTVKIALVLAAALIGVWWVASLRQRRPLGRQRSASRPNA